MRRIEDILAVPVAVRGGRSILLRDIATVIPGRVSRHYQVHGNGLPAVAFMVFKQPSANTIDVVHGIDQKLARLKALLPAGAKIRKYYNQADIISEARNSLFHDLLMGALLAAAVLFFFMGTFRATLIVTAAIPITLLATLAIMRILGQTLNVITLSALTLAVGMVVDDAIVVTENVVRHLQSGRDRQTASLNGAAEIAGPDASGTFTTVAAFAPLLFLSGIAGLFVRPFGLVISVALLASLIVSLTFVPMLFGRTGVSGQRHAMGTPLLAWLDRVLQRALHFTFAHRGITILLTVLALGLGGLAAWLGPINVLPHIDEGAILIEYTMPPGTSLKESDRIGDILEREALAQPDIQTVYRRTGSPEHGSQIEGVNRGELTIKLLPRSSRTRTLDQIMAALRHKYSKIPGVAFLYHQPTQEKMDESLSGLPAIFGVTIFGTDLPELVTLAAEAEKIMARDPALSNIINNTRIKSPQIIVHPDPMELSRYGL
ncbi:Cobalt-zinc-cadmium resistance protein CzcA; Cation efflux system protein CusA, partial [hydrothermal vent metagenome]